MQGFGQLGLDERIVRSLSECGYERPTSVQKSAIPALLDGKSVLIQACTGSGKTLAYMIPLVHHILSLSSNNHKRVHAIIVLPTRELANQTSRVLAKLCKYCKKTVDFIDVSGSRTSKGASNATSMAIFKRQVHASPPAVVIGTPSELTQLFREDNPRKSLSYLVIDEADLISSVGHSIDAMVDMFAPVDASSKKLQTVLVSATANASLEMLAKTRFPHAKKCSVNARDTQDPELSGSAESPQSAPQLTHYLVLTNEQDKFLLAYILFKLNLIPGKKLVFVNNIDRGYRLKLFLDQFGVRSAVLNAELPLNSRVHIIEAFNRGNYAILIATDLSGDESPSRSKETDSTNSSKLVVDSLPSRGIDFERVACVFNFDFPTTGASFVHRVGRSARGNESRGISISFCVPSNEWGKHKAFRLDTARNDESVLNVIKSQFKIEFTEYKFDMRQAETFRYRVNDAYRAVTSAVVKEARQDELRHELVNSEKLRNWFDQHELDRAALTHDIVLHKRQKLGHLKRVPSYLLSQSTSANSASNNATDADSSSSDNYAANSNSAPASGVLATPSLGFVPFRRQRPNRIKAAREKNRQRKSKKPLDPLKRKLK